MVSEMTESKIPPINNGHSVIVIATTMPGLTNYVLS